MNIIEKLRPWLTTWSPRKKRFAIIAAVVVVLDQWSKYWAVEALTTAMRSPETLSMGEKISRFLWTEHPRYSAPVTVHPDFWRFIYAENPGAAWSFLAQAPEWFRVPFFLAMAVVASILIVVYFRKTTDNQWSLRLALALVFGGAVGNFIDRARLGYVIDFIQWHWYDKAAWPTFNVADIAISVALVLMVIDMILVRDPKAAKSPEKRADKQAAQGSHN